MAGGKRELGVASWPFTYVVHALGVVVSVLVLVWTIHFRGGLAFVATNKALIFNVHPVLMFIGFIFLGGEAVVAYRVVPGSKQQRKLVHLALHLIALVLGIVGIYAAFKYHNDSGIVNLYSLHSWIGLATISLYGVQWVFGFVTFFYPGAPERVRATSLPWNVLFGSFVYTLALLTAALGFLEKLTFLESSGLDKYGAEALFVNFTAVIVVLFGAFVILSTLASPPPVVPTTREELGYNTATRVMNDWLHVFASFHLFCVSESRPHGNMKLLLSSILIWFNKICTNVTRLDRSLCI